MEEVRKTCPDWRRLRPSIPANPCVFVSESAVPVREYEAALLTELQWPQQTTPQQKAVCVRAMASQLLPLIMEYTQLRDHLQSYLGQLHTWHTEVLMPYLQNVEQEMNNLKLRAFVQAQSWGPSHVHPSAAPSLRSQGAESIAESIASAQAVAASLRSQGPAAFFGQGEVGPNQGQRIEPHLGQAEPHHRQGTATLLGPNQEQQVEAHHRQAVLNQAVATISFDQGQQPQPHFGQAVPNPNNWELWQSEFGSQQQTGEATSPNQPIYQ